MKKPSGSAAAKQASSTRPGFQPSAAAQFTAIEISSGRIGRMRKPFMAGDRADGLMNPYHSGRRYGTEPKTSANIVQLRNLFGRNSHETCECKALTAASRLSTGTNKFTECGDKIYLSAIIPGCCRT